MLTVRLLKFEKAKSKAIEVKGAYGLEQNPADEGVVDRLTSEGLAVPEESLS